MKYKENERITVDYVAYIRSYSFLSMYNGRETFVHKFLDSDGDVMVWKTQNPIALKKPDGSLEFLNEDDTITLKATVKGEIEYNGKRQINLTRCKVVSIDNKAMTKEEKDKIKAEEMIASLDTGDEVVTMSYRNYKEHYSDCETLPGSFNTRNGTIKVVVRFGRMKNSGVRGRHFDKYKVTYSDGDCFYFRAVCKENAIKQAKNYIRNLKS